MVAITFLDPTGNASTIEATVGRSVMQAAMEHDVAGILGDCGGWCSCATCHVIVGDKWAMLLPVTDENEQAVLEGTIGTTARSRLACQIEVSPEIDGLVLEVPAFIN